MAKITAAARATMANKRSEVLGPISVTRLVPTRTRSPLPIPQ